MARDKKFAPNIDNSSPLVYPNGRIQDNTGSGNGTPVNNYVYSDLHEMKDKLFRLYGIDYNGLPDNETNGFQTIEALRALASKNDFILDLTDNAGILSVPIKLGFMLQKEAVLCLSGVNFVSQTQIRGLDNVTFNLTILGSFKSGEYVRLIKTVSGITLIREVDAVNLDLAVGEFLYLKKASQTQENLGLLDSVATTPLTNLTAFIRRVNGVDSSNYLATQSLNGLLSASDKVIIDGIGTSPIKNKGWVAGLDVSGTSGPLAVSGDFTSANASLIAGVSVVNVILANNMINTNYLCQMFIESQGVITNDNRIANIVFKPISINQFQFCIGETGSILQNLKIHIKVEQL